MKLSYLFSLLFSALFFSSVQSAELLHQEMQTSRDTSYISFHNNDSPFVFAGIVGGEHTSIYKLLGFAGQVYQITFISIEGDSSANIYGDGFAKFKVRHKNSTLTQVDVIAEQVFVTIDISALTYGEYKLIIEKKAHNSAE